MSTSSSILNGYESDIKKKELKNGCLLQETVVKMCTNFVKNLKFAVLRDLEKYHPNEKGVINVVELFLNRKKIVVCWTLKAKTKAPLCSLICYMMQ